MPPPQEITRKVCKLAQLPEEVRQSRWAVSVTRLTVLKGLCQDALLANRFALFLARRTWDRLQRRQGRSARPHKAKVQAHPDVGENLSELFVLPELPRGDLGKVQKPRLKELLLGLRKGPA